MSLLKNQQTRQRLFTTVWKKATWSFFALALKSGAGKCAAVFCLLLFLGQPSRAALTITNVTPANVTPSSFSLVCQTFEPATPTVSIYRDAAGVTNLAGLLSVEAFPLHSGNPDLTNAYDQRQYRAALRQKSESFGHMQIKVSGCEPNTTYYYRLQVTDTNGQQLVYPVSGLLPAVTTAVENTFVPQSRQLIVDISNGHGRILTLSHTNAHYPISAVVGDGAGSNQVFFSLSDLFAQVGRTNFIPLGNHEFTVELLGPSAQNQKQQFTVNFTADFSVATAQVMPFNGDYVILSLGSAILQTGQSNSFSLGTVASAPMTNVSFILDMPTNRFTNVTLETLISAISTATLQSVSPGRYAVNLKTGPGQFLQATQLNIARVKFTAISNQPSAFVRLSPQNFTTKRADGVSVTNLFAQEGRIVVIGAEPLMETTFLPDQSRALTLYGNPGLSYGIEISTNLAAGWQLMMRLPMTNLWKMFSGTEVASGTVFYRSYEFKAEPPLLDAQRGADGSGRRVTLYGKAGKQYTLEAANSLSHPVTWNPVLNVTLTNSYYVTNSGSIASNVFYRLRQ